MAKTLAQIRNQIEKLEKEAENVKAKEVAGVVARIRKAIEFYALTAEDLFATSAKRVGRPKRVVGAALKKAAVPRFKDPASDKTWTGHGKRPGWFVQAIEDGKKPEDLAV